MQKTILEPLPRHAVLEVGSPRRLDIRDFVALTKPRITFNVTLTAALGLFVAGRMPATPAASTLTMVSTLIGTALIVSGANALNMFIERDIDRHMPRTRNRPLSGGRMDPLLGLWAGVALSAMAFPILAIGANPLTALLAVVAHLLYVLAYTPLKQKSFYALHVGAIPGAIPPLLGWTAVTERLDAGGAVLFAFLFFWQIPHFVAIALFRKADYARAGLVVLPNVVGELISRHTIVRWTVAVVATSLLLVPLGLAHRGYLVIATLLGAIFLAWGCYGFRPDTGNKWAKSLFAVSILYQVALFAALVIDPFANL
jgi:protoheme IX farnesyltransferase